LGIHANARGRGGKRQEKSQIIARGIAAPISLNEKRNQEGGFVLVEENLHRQPSPAKLASMKA